MTPSDSDEVFDNKPANYATSVVFGAVVLAFALYMAINWEESRTAKLAVLGVGILAAASLVLGTIRRVRVGDDAFNIEYLAWKKVVRYANVTNIEIQDLKVGYGQEVEIIVIKRRRGLPLKLRVAFEDGVIPVYSALHKRWSRVIPAKAGI
jgi:hypothetical protein